MGHPKHKRLDWFKFFPSDFLHGTKTWDNEHVGIYIRLLANCWLEMPECGIENTPKHILSCLNNTDMRSRRVIDEVVKSKFSVTTVTKNGRTFEIIVNPRQLRERDEVIDITAVRSAAGSAERGQAPDGAEAMAGHLSGQNGEHIEEMRGEEKRSRGDGDKGTTTRLNPATKSPKALHHMFRALWQSKKGLAAVCRLPVGDKMAPWWKEVCESHPAELLERAFELWVDERGARLTTDNPIYDFLKAPYSEWLEKIDPTKKFSSKGDVEASMAAFVRPSEPAPREEVKQIVNPLEGLE